MKRLFVIWLVLCTWVCYPMLQAQIYTTSSATYQSYSTGGTYIAPVPSSFRSTSAYITNSTPIHNSIHPVSSTAPLHVANGTIKTVASTIQGGVLAEEGNNPSNPARIQGRKNTMAPPEYTQPIGEGWDVALFVGFCCAIYVLSISRKRNQTA